MTCSTRRMALMTPHKACFTFLLIINELIGEGLPAKVTRSASQMKLKTSFLIQLLPLVMVFEPNRAQTGSHIVICFPAERDFLLCFTLYHGDMDIFATSDDLFASVTLELLGRKQVLLGEVILLYLRFTL